MKNLIILFFAFAIVSCANAPFPEMLEESHAIKADNKNVAYEDGELEAEKVEPAKTKPVFKGKVDDMDKTQEPIIVVKEEAFVEEIDQEVVAPENIKSQEPSIVYLAETFYFDNGSATLQNANKKIKNIVQAAKKQNAHVKVLGYASSRTRNTDPVSHKMANFKVSLERANAVARALKRAGLSQEMIIVEALSDAVPAYQEVMPEGERLNRRAEVYIVY